MKGVMEKAISELQENIIKNKGLVDEAFLIEYAKVLQKNKHHVHIVIQGPNGAGKSYLALYLAKLFNPNSIKNNNILYAYHTPIHFIDMVSKRKEDVIMIDEGKRFFDYKMHGTIESIYVQQAIEYARENRNIVLTCAKDIRRLNNNYRDGQVQIIIWILDRFEKPIDGYIGYAAVFIGNPILEDSDKFKLEVFSNATTLNEIKFICEQVSPTFWGYMLIKDVEKFLTKEEIQIYKEKKEKGMLKFSEHAKARIINKNKLMYGDIEEEEEKENEQEQVLDDRLLLQLKKQLKKEEKKMKKD